MTAPGATGPAPIAPSSPGLVALPSAVLTVSIPGLTLGQPGPGSTFEARVGGPSLVPNLALALPPSTSAGAPQAGATPAPDAPAAVEEVPEGVAQEVALDRDAAPEDLTPLGSGLITELFPFDRASIEGSLALFLDQFGDELTPVKGPRAPSRYPALVVAAVVALEAARRFRRRSSGSAEPGGVPGIPNLHGLS